MIWYVPGCDVSRNHPEASARAAAYMQAKGIPLGPCCRKDVSFVKDGDTLVINCTQCALIFAERLPNTKLLSMYEYLLGDGDFAWPERQGETMVLQDCLRTRQNKAMQDAVRQCLANMHVNVIEAEHNRQASDFCGVWLNNPAASDCVEAAPETFARLEKQRVLLSKDAQKAKMEAYVAAAPTEKIIVYCNGCEKGIRLGNGKPVHMIELLFGS